MPSFLMRDTVIRPPHVAMTCLINSISKPNLAIYLLHIGTLFGHITERVYVVNLTNTSKVIELAVVYIFLGCP